jgi:hypothetical protein
MKEKKLWVSSFEEKNELFSGKWHPALLSGFRF